MLSFKAYGEVLGEKMMTLLSDPRGQKSGSNTGSVTRTRFQLGVREDILTITCCPQASAPWVRKVVSSPFLGCAGRGQ